MKILGISSSPRGSQSQTLKLVRVVLESAKSAGADVELVDICKLNIEYCIGCGVCYKMGACIKKDDFTELYGKMLASDGMIWGSPNYFRSCTAQMKTLIDRMADVVHCQLFTGKYSCSVATGGGDFEQATNYLDALLLNFGSFVTGSLGSVMSQGPEAMEDAEKKASEMGRNLAEDIRTKRVYPTQRERHEENRKYFQELVKVHGKDWEHEFEHWNRLNWK
jgi:multimeric flavodoxin WrbA